MTPRKLTEAEVAIEVIAEPDDIPVRGNAMASGDDAADRALEDEILARLDQGDVWAWAFVRVRATWGGFSGEATLGACSYAGEADFREPGGYFDDLKREAIDQLNDEIAKVATKIATLEEVR